MTRYNTNLASEYYVLACLHRLGATANLTLGNKKGVDIVVVRDAGDAVTVEVKGVADKYEWPADNLVSANPEMRNPLQTDHRKRSMPIRQNAACRSTKTLMPISRNAPMPISFRPCGVIGDRHGRFRLRLT